MKKLFAVILTLTAFGSRPHAFCATSFADRVLSYSAGTGTDAGYTNSSAALGAPSPIVGAGTGFDGVFSPFNPHYETTDLVQVGNGGQITLGLSRPVRINRTGLREIGIWENVGLQDAAYPNGTVTNPATQFGSDSAVVEVSADNVTWYSLNSGNPILFTLPGNYYTNAGPYDSSAPASPQFADFGLPFTGALASFDGKTYPQVLSTLGGSAGGTWLDLDAVPVAVTQIEYIRFSGVAAGQTFDLDAVAINTSLAVPEPGSLALCGFVLIACGFGRFRRSCAT